MPTSARFPQVNPGLAKDLQAGAGFAVDGAHAGDPMGEAVEGVGFARFGLVHVGAEEHGGLFVAVQGGRGEDNDARPLLEVAHPLQNFEAAAAK